MIDYFSLENAVDAEAAIIWDMASYIWEFAELGYEEVESARYEVDVLEKNGFKLRDQGIGGFKSSWIATWGRGSPVIGLLVEFDALPNLGNDTAPKQISTESTLTNGHGCGHNLIGPAAIGAGIALKNHMKKENIPGTIKLIGCPAKEALSSKNYMASDGAFDNLDVCLHNHPGPENIVWNFHSAVWVELQIEWHGKGAKQAAKLFVSAADRMLDPVLQTAKTNHQTLKRCQVLSSKSEYVKILFGYHDLNAEKIQDHGVLIKDMATEAARATQSRDKVTILTGVNDCLQNNVFAQRMNDHMNRYFPIEWTDEEQSFAKTIQREMGLAQDGMADTVMPVPLNIELAGASDMGDVSWIVPTMGVVYASWPRHLPPHQWGCTATGGMSIGLKASLQAAHVLAATGLDLLTDVKLLKAVQTEFDKRTAGQPYKSLLESRPASLDKRDFRDRMHYECCIHAVMEYLGIDEPDTGHNSVD